MSDIDLSMVDSLGDFLTNEVFEIQAVTIPEGFSGITADEINLRAQTFTIPDTPVSYLSISHRTFDKRQPTRRENLSESVTMGMVETMTVKTLPFLRDWANRCATKGTNYVYPPEQRQMEFIVYHKKNDRTTAWVYNLKHVQLIGKGEISLNNDVNPIIPQLTMNTDLILEGPTVDDLK